MIAPRCRHIALAPLPAVLFFAVAFLLSAQIYIPLLISITVQGFFLFFFRDPERLVGEGIVSPADGRVVEVTKDHISIFMNIWDVHVNRAPLAGTIKSMHHFPGHHTPAFREIKANEHLNTILTTNTCEITVVQIAGIFARRIVPYVGTGSAVTKGQRLGIVRFGSRVELQIPIEVIWQVTCGDRVRAGQTIGILR